MFICNRFCYVLHNAVIAILSPERVHFTQKMRRVSPNNWSQIRSKVVKYLNSYVFFFIFLGFYVLIFTVQFLRGPHTVVCRSSWQPTKEFTAFFVVLGGAGFESGSAGLQRYIPLSHLTFSYTNFPPVLALQSTRRGLCRSKVTWSLGPAPAYYIYSCFLRIKFYTC
jgi:hypothetical protein